VKIAALQSGLDGGRRSRPGPGPGRAAAQPGPKLFPREAAFSPGSDLPVYEAGAARFGIVICCDCDYVEPARFLRLKGSTSAGPAATTGMSGTTRRCSPPGGHAYGS
jgi:hypothetical protein